MKRLGFLACAALGFFAACSAEIGSEGNADAGHGELDGDVAPTRGLRASYFADYYGPPQERVDPAIDFDWSEGEPLAGVGADHFAVRWSGELLVPTEGTYSFAASADDGLRLWIDGDTLINRWRVGSDEDSWIDVELSEGAKDFKLTYFEATGPARMQLRWRRPDGTEEVIPSEFFSTTTAPVETRSPRPPYQNPILDAGCADPGVYFEDDWYYLVCTGGRFRIRRSRDLINWTLTDSYILPAGGPPWSVDGKFRWAPEIHRVRDDRVVAYFTASDDKGEQALGAAYASTPLGPYTLGSKPLLTHPIGVIDPSFFKDDDGTNYLLWKVAGTSEGQPTPIFIRQLGPGGMAFSGGSTAKELIRNQAGTWEGSTTEAPWLIKRNGWYYLFYSGNAIDERYRVGVARSQNVLGPYTKHSGPILGNNADWVGPGHQAVIEVDGIHYLMYHAWPTNAAGDRDEAKGRLLMLDRINWVDGWPTVAGDGTPKSGLQPAPGLDPDA